MSVISMELICYSVHILLYIEIHHNLLPVWRLGFPLYTRLTNHLCVVQICVFSTLCHLVFLWLVLGVFHLVLRQTV